MGSDAGKAYREGAIIGDWIVTIIWGLLKWTAIVSWLSLVYVTRAVVLVGRWVMRRFKSGGLVRTEGHYSSDGGWWWNDGTRQWYRCSDEVSTFEIEVEQSGMLSSSTERWRFIARAREGGGSSGTFMVAHADFPKPSGVSADDLTGSDRDEANEHLEWLRRAVTTTGWLPDGHGSQWYSDRYRQPMIYWDTPKDAYAQSMK